MKRFEGVNVEFAVQKVFFFVVTLEMGLKGSVKVLGQLR